MNFQTDGARPRARFFSALALVGLLAACSGATATPSSEPTCIQADADNVVELSAQDLQFSAECIEVAAGEPITIEFTNMESQPHDVAVYQDSSKATEVMRGEIITGPDVSTTYQVPALEAGDHYFDCSIHTAMKGILRAVEAPAAS
ncbi:MAG: cupredoxin domain-containing protein [Chloroflexota bacterium]